MPIPFPRELYFTSYRNEFIAYSATEILAHGVDKAVVIAAANKTGVDYEITYCRFTPAPE